MEGASYRYLLVEAFDKLLEIVQLRRSCQPFHLLLEGRPIDLR